MSLFSLNVLLKLFIAILTSKNAVVLNKRSMGHNARLNIQTKLNNRCLNTSFDLIY